jgi:positive regulator of sigma E activity
MEFFQDPIIIGILAITFGAIMLFLSNMYPAFKSFAITLLTFGVNKIVAKKKAKKENSESKKDV